MSDSPIPPRPQTPQVLLHRLPEKPADDDETSTKPSKFIVLIMGSTAAPGKLQIARSTAGALSCPFYQGEALHESSAKAASVGASTSTGANETRYKRMWLSKLTRTGLLFPEESRPATEGFSGFGGTSSTSTSRRGSVSSVASASSDTSASPATASARSSWISRPVAGVVPSMPPSSVHNQSFTVSEQERLRRTNPALVVLTHPELEKWHKLAIRTAIGEYRIGVIFVPLYEELVVDTENDEEEDMPILRPLDPSTMTSFPLSSAVPITLAGTGLSLEKETTVHISVNADVDGKIIEITHSVKELIGLGD